MDQSSMISVKIMNNETIQAFIMEWLLLEITSPVRIGKLVYRNHSQTLCNYCGFCRGSDCKSNKMLKHE